MVVGTLSLVLQACSAGPDLESDGTGVRDPIGAHETEGATTSSSTDADVVEEGSSSTGDEGATYKPEAGESSTGELDGNPSPAKVCPDGPSCFSWCGVQKSDGECVRAVPVEATPPVDLLCPSLHLTIDADGAASLGEGSTHDDVRCFMQAIRYSNEGSLSLSWLDTESGYNAMIEMRLNGDQTVDLAMRSRRGADCGEMVTLWAPSAHTQVREDALYTACLDTSPPASLQECLLGPAASFHTSFDTAFGSPFPWLSGYCIP